MAPPGADPQAGRVLLLGWNAGRAAAALAGLGARVTCVTEPSQAAAARNSGLVERTVAVADSADTEAVLAALARAGRRPHDYAAVAPSQELRMVAASVLGALGGTRALPLATALALRDKALQKHLIRTAGIPTARSVVAESPVEVPLAPFAFPVVVKALNGHGSLGAERLRSPAHARTWTYRPGDDGPWQVEEFVPGPEIHLDGAVRGGVVTALAASRYLGNVLDTHHGAPMGSVVADPRRDPDLYRHGRSLATRALAALGHDDGVFHLEAFEQPDGSLVFGECAGRVAGGRIDEVVRRKFGVDLHAQWAAALLGLPAPPAAAHPDDEAFGFLRLSAAPGVVDEAPDIEEILSRDGVVTAEHERRTRGARTGRPVSFAVFRAVLTGKDEAHVAQHAQDLTAWFDHRMDRIVRGKAGIAEDDHANAQSSTGMLANKEVGP
ncbi:acetyl-CoA carboxylase biotin carboxylase subunit family protein [Streptomyces sp. NPDC058000]|uniref:ATP-grasp domain-containing protein n=1 Tax=Streptomyces sp. NPDC058000 TaxID=3346299 RepID=UPI0036EE2AAF